MSVIQGNAIESGLAAYEIPNSLRFNSADSAYLSRTPASAGNRKTWTFSAWVKRSAVGSTQGIFHSYDGASSRRASIQFNSNDTIGWDQGGSGSSGLIDTVAVYRDVSAWYHIVCVADYSNGTAANRAKIYINNVLQTVTTTDDFDNADGLINSTNAHQIGSVETVSYFNGYISEVNFIDGQALDPTSFGEYNSDTGVWQPKAYAGSYGTNGFYLPMTQDQIVEGFNTVLYRSGLGKNRVTGVGFKPSMVWVKNRDVIQEPSITDAVRGVNSQLRPAYTSAESTYTDCLTSFDADGFTLGTDATNNSYNYYSGNAVAWCWDAGNSTVSNTDGTITSSVRASQTYGFSVVTWTNAGNGNDTVGHGLGTAPKLIITKKRSTANDWYTFTTAIDGSYDYLKLNATDAKVDSAKAAPTSTVFTTDMGDTSTAVAYCFTDSNYSKFGSYTGNGSSTGPTVTLGWKPAFVLIKKTSDVDDWAIFDTTRQTTNAITKVLNINSASEATGTSPYITVSDTGFQITATSNMVNTNGGTYIYAAFKDQREAAFWRDFSGNGNHWQPNNLDFNDSVVDVPTNYGTDTGVGGEVRGNYATLNPLQNGGLTITNGNLTWAGAGSSVKCATGSIAMTSGKWYFEALITGSSGGNWYSGVCNLSPTLTSAPSATATGWGLVTGGGGTVLYKSNNNVLTSLSSSSVTGSVVSFAVDVDAGKIWFAQNGTWLEGSPSAGTGASYTNLTGTQIPYVAGYDSNDQGSINFGQRPFAYTAPSGFKALCTQNLPEPTVVDGGDYFNAVLWTGNGSTQTITTGIANDLVWTKDRGAAYDHTLFDVIRTPGYFLRSNATSAEEYRSDSLTAFTSTGFSVGADSVRQNINKSGNAYVSWAWKAGGTGVTNTAGTITGTVTVSANTTAGFSIVTYTGNGTSGATVGHGLGAVPKMLIVKNRSDGTRPWAVYHASISGAPGNILYLNSTSAANADNQFDLTPTPTVFSLGSGTYTNKSGDSMVCYAFAPIAGYSAFGSYVGNGSSDGPFVYTGFRPRYVMWKISSGSTGDWYIVDSVRDTYNVASKTLWPDLSNAEGSGANLIDFVSNGFKVRNAGGSNNGSGYTFIYAAFAENPFKFSLAR